MADTSSVPHLPLRAGHERSRLMPATAWRKVRSGEIGVILWRQQGSAPC